MKFVPDDEDAPVAKIAGLELAEIAALLAEVEPVGDAYDVLRDVLTSLSDQSRDRRGSTH